MQKERNQLARTTMKGPVLPSTRARWSFLLRSQLPHHFQKAPKNLDDEADIEAVLFGILHFLVPSRSSGI